MAKKKTNVVKFVNPKQVTRENVVERLKMISELTLPPDQRSEEEKEIEDILDFLEVNFNTTLFNYVMGAIYEFYELVDKNMWEDLQTGEEYMTYTYRRAKRKNY